MKLMDTHKSMIRYCSILLLFVCIYLNANAQKEMNEGYKLMKKNNFHEALLTYKKAEKKIDENEHQTKARCLSKIGECYMELGYYSLALPYFEQAIKYDSTYVYSLNSYTEALKNNGKYTEAVRIFKQQELNKEYSEHDSKNITKDIAYYNFPLQNFGDNKLFSIRVQNNINTLGKKRGLSIIDGKLHYSTTNYAIIPDQKNYIEKTNEYTTFFAEISDNYLSNPGIYNNLMDIGYNITYAVIHPTTKNLFFTALASDDKEYLYECKEKNGKWQSPNKVKVGKKAIPLSHPVFTQDGSIMIFSAKLPNGNGKKDLWYSKQTEKGWSNPINLGDSINTPGDEITPFLYNNYLFFSSNGHVKNYGGFDIYCTQWNNNNIPTAVDNLKLPYNSFADDFDFIIDNESNNGFFISTRDYKSLDDKIYSFAEIPYFTIIKGTVYDNFGNSLPGADITVFEDNIPLFAVKTNNEGKFQIYLKNNREYKLDISKENYLSTKKTYTTNSNKKIGNTLQYEKIHLNGFELNKTYKLDSLFHQTASLELLQSNIKLTTIETFLKENTHLDLYLFVFGFLTDNDKFNELLNANRINVLSNHFVEQSINENRIHFKSYSNEIPTNFDKIDRNEDTTYLIYFLFAPKNAEIPTPATTSVQH